MGVDEEAEAGDRQEGWTHVYRLSVSPKSLVNMNSTFICERKRTHHHVPLNASAISGWSKKTWYILRARTCMVLYRGVRVRSRYAHGVGGVS